MRTSLIAVTGALALTMFPAQAGAHVPSSDGIGLSRLFGQSGASLLRDARWPYAEPTKAAVTPKATCGAGDRPESGLQGQPVPRDAGFRSDGFRCNLELVGQYVGDGAAYQLAWYGDCAYMATLYRPEDPEYDQLKGTVVLDVSDPARPRPTGRLQTPAMVSPHESLKATANGLLGATQGAPTPQGLPGSPDVAGPRFDLYDVRESCRKPRLLSSVDIPGGSGHAGSFAPDGRTYYASTILNAPAPAIIAIDLSDPRAPRTVSQWPSPLNTTSGFHDLVVSADGRTGYFAAQGGEENGVALVDLTGVQERRPSAVPAVIGKVSWHDTNIAQIPVPARIGGRDYLIVSDEFGTQLAPEQACQAGTDPYGSVHIVDVADPRAPQVVSGIRLEVNDPANCDRIIGVNPGLSITNSSHYCAVDDPAQTRAVACTWFGGGLRVFDVRDPLHPREIAYYNPSPRPETVRGAAGKTTGIPSPLIDAAASTVRWVRAHDGSVQLWFQSMQNGFQVVRFTHGAYRFTDPPTPAPTRKCSSRRQPQITLTVPRGFRLRSATLRVGREQARRVRPRRVADRRVRTVADLRGRPGGRVTVRFRAVGRDGRAYVTVRRYRLCRPSSATGR